MRNMLLIKMIQKECLLLYRDRQEWMLPLIFFVLVCVLFPLATSADLNILKLFAPGIVWVAALLAILLSLPNLFREDFLDGSLDQWLLAASQLILILAKVIAYWIMIALPLMVVAPILGLMFHLSGQGIAVLMETLAIGTAVLLLLGSLASALTV